MVCRTALILVMCAVLVYPASPLLARAGGGESYREVQTESGVPATNGGTGEAAAVRVNELSESRSTSGKIREEEARATADWYKQHVKVTPEDYRDLRLFGITVAAFLLLAGVGVAAFMTLVAERSEAGFLKDRLIPVLAINGVTWILTWAVLRAFDLPFWPLAIGIVPTAAFLVRDAFLGSSPGPKSGL